MSASKSIGTKRYIAQRVIQTIIVWFAIVTINFFIFRVMPGDPRASLIAEHMTQAQRDAIALKFGLDRPLFEQYILYIVNIFRGDLGESFSNHGEAVMVTIFDHRFMNTITIMGVALVASIIIGTIMGVIAASRRDTPVDTGSTVTFLVAYSIPVFWIGLLILLFLGSYIDIVPISGTITRGYEHVNFLEFALDYGWHMLGPTVVLTMSFIGGFYLIMRDSVLDVFTQDYMLAARAKGLKEKTILYGHAMRNALLPLVSIIAINIPFLISGAVMTETVFSWEGLGKLTFNSVLVNDYPVLQGLFLFLATITVIANLIADIAYLYLDPRIRY
ncbi:MAG: ABC transporter permease [Candidatus Thorarchaeota archaeon]